MSTSRKTARAAARSTRARSTTRSRAAATRQRFPAIEAFTDAYLHLVARGFRVHWTDLRMTLPTHAESAPHGAGVVLSNWEI